MSENKLSFEEAFERLEKILDTMNEGKVPLEESLKLFEEANYLIKKCDFDLSSAEKKIETLIKNRSGDLAIDNNQKPQTEPFRPNKTQILDS